jgi:hypothetical protein
MDQSLSTLKTCSSCYTQRDLELDFHRDRSQEDGRSRRCKACKQASDADRYRRTAVRRRAAQQAAYRKCQELLRRLKSAPCTDCTGSFPYQVMQFDHPNPRNKKANVADVVSTGSVNSLLAEIAKCDLVCSNCHILRTVRQIEAGVIKMGRPRTVVAA